jgi:hypothetical protein
MRLFFTKRIENMFWHKDAYEEKVRSKVESKLKTMLAGLDEELSAGQIPTNFRIRIDAIYQEIMGKCNCM